MKRPKNPKHYMKHDAKYEPNQNNLQKQHRFISSSQIITALKHLEYEYGTNENI